MFSYQFNLSMKGTVVNQALSNALDCCLFPISIEETGAMHIIIINYTVEAGARRHAVWKTAATEIPGRQQQFDTIQTSHITTR
jgi:hypothetical protein